MVKTISVTFRMREQLITSVDLIIEKTGFFTGRADYVSHAARVYIKGLIEGYDWGMPDFEEKKKEKNQRIFEIVAIDEYMFKAYTGSFIPVNLRLPEGLYLAIQGFGILTGSYDNIQIFLRAAVSSAFESESMASLKFITYLNEGKFPNEAPVPGRRLYPSE